MLVEKFIKKTKGFKIWPLINNWSVYTGSTHFVSQKYFNSHYEDRTINPLIFVANKQESFFTFTENKAYNLLTEGFWQCFYEPKQFKKRIIEFNDRSKKNDGFYKKYSYKKINDLDWNDLVGILDSTIDNVWSLNGLLWFVIFPFDKITCLEQINRAKIKLTEKEVDEVWAIGTEPIFDSFDRCQKLHFLKLLAAGKSWSEIAQSCQYFFIDYGFCAKSVSDTEKALKEKFAKFNSRETARKEISRLGKESKQKIIKFKRRLKTLTNNQKKLVGFLQLIMEIRDRRKNIFNKTLIIHHRIAEKVFLQANMPFDLIPFASMKEVKMGFKFLKNHIKEIQARTKGCALYIDEKSISKVEKINYQYELSRLRAHYLKSHKLDEIADVDEIEGNIGAPGKILGRVKIILDYKKDGSSFRDGEILATGMTRPEFVPLMKKASAIITDEGGITCHAAIVSRELGIPCIIGTKIATKVLKDGDIVEVDADKGVVKKIK